MLVDGRNYFLSINKGAGGGRGKGKGEECFSARKMKAYRFLLENLWTTRLMETHVL